MESAKVRNIYLQEPSTPLSQERSDLRGPRRHLIARAESRNLQGIHKEHAPQDKIPRVQCHPADGCHGARLLRFVRLPSQFLLRSKLKIRDPRGPERAD